MRDWIQSCGTGLHGTEPFACLAQDEWKRKRLQREILPHGRQRQGKPKSSSHSSQAPKLAGRKTVADHIYAIGSDKQASDYSVITAFIVNHIRKTFEYGDGIGDALESRTETVFAAPTLQPVDFSLTVDQKTPHERQFETLCRAEVTTHVTCKDKCQANKGKAYALIYSQCNKAMQHKLQSRTDYESTVKGDPTKLLDATSEHSVSHMENKCHVSIVVNGMKNFINLRQKKDKSLVDYTHWFKAAMKVMESHTDGDLVLPKLAKLDPEHVDNYDPNVDPPESAPKECLKRAYKRHSTYLHMENADWTKYGSLLTALSSQCSLGNDHVLSNHKFDQSYCDTKSKKAAKEKADKDRQRELARNCKEEESPQLSFAQMENCCYCCGKKGHTSPKCPKKDSTPKSEWVVHQTPELQGVLNPQQINA